MRREFDKALKQIAAPALAEHGYLFDGKRRFTKEGPDGEPLIIEYQVGVQGAAGTFTVNLVKGNELVRLHRLNPTWFSTLVRGLFGDYDPWWKDVFLPKERWLRICPFQKEMDSIVMETVKALKVYGMGWLEGGER